MGIPCVAAVREDGSLDYAILNREQVVSESDPYTLDRYRQFFRHFPKDARRVLDVGCNTGRGGQVLKSLDSRLSLTGVDIVHERLSRIDPALYDETIYGDCTDLVRCGIGSFDVIVAGELIEHLDPADVDKALREWFRLLRLGGRLIVTTPNPRYLRSKLTGMSVMDDPSHVTQHFPEILRLRLMMIGYSNVRLAGSGRVSKYLGQNFPLLSMYGSFLMSADKR